MSDTDNMPVRQLQMVRQGDLQTAPPWPVLPGEYELRTFEPEDEAGYLRLMVAAGFDGFDGQSLRRHLVRALPDGFYLAVHRASVDPVATTMALHASSPLHPGAGEVGWVATDPAHTGRRLGRAACAAATIRLLREGYTRIYLNTDDWRLPAIWTYLQLGFVPFLFAPDMELRWQAVCKNLRWPFTPDGWPRHPEESGANTPD